MSEETRSREGVMEDRIEELERWNAEGEGMIHPPSGTMPEQCEAQLQAAQEKFTDLDAAFRRYRARTDAEIERLRGALDTIANAVHEGTGLTSDEMRHTALLALTPEGTQVIGPMHPYPKEDTGMATRLPAPEGTQDD